MLFSSRTSLVSRFLCRNSTSRKNYEKSYFTRRPMEPEDRRERRPGGPSRTGGAAQAWPRQPCVREAWPPSQPPLWRTYTPWRDNIRETVFFPDRLPLRCRHQKPRFGTRNSVLAPCRDGDSEEIFVTITTDAPPSTIHDSPIHLWVISSL
jgi:hypothetical protein